MYVKLLFTSLGQVEVSGQSQWKLISIVNNTQRGSQQRMIEKFRFTAQGWHQFIGESELTRMERQLERERDIAREEKKETETDGKEVGGREEQEGERAGGGEEQGKGEGEGAGRREEQGKGEG